MMFLVVQVGIYFELIREFNLVSANFWYLVGDPFKGATFESLVRESGPPLNTLSYNILSIFSTVSNHVDSS